MILNKFVYSYFLILFAAIPVSIVAGPSISLLNIIIIDFSFICLIIYLRNFDFLKNKTFFYLLILYSYLIFNSIISLEPYEGIYRNLGFIRIIIFFIAVNFFFNQKLFFKKVFWIWLIVISIIVFDVYFERFSGENLLGFGKEYGQRIVSFFKDEPIVGGYINGFFLLIIGFLLDTYKNYNQKKIILLSLIFITAIFLTGERSNSIKALIGLTIFYTIILNTSIKKKILSVIFGFILLIGLISSSEFLKLRFYDQIKAMATGNNYYFTIYNSGFEVFKRYPFFGVGNKNYRVETCEKFEELKEIYICVTHPHQIYIEFLAEHGLVGTIFLLFIFYKLIFSKIIMVIKNKSCLQLGALIYVVLIFLPLLPSGAFFSNYMMTFFALNISILYATNSKTNIFINK